MALVVLLLLALLAAGDHVSWAFSPWQSAVATIHTGRWFPLHAAARSICTFEASDFVAPAWPYRDADFSRMDASDDARFYDEPRFITHIDDGAIDALTSYYQDVFRQQQRNNNKGRPLDILDLCSSWISHLPQEEADAENGIRYGRVVGLGMNRQELEANPQLTEVACQDLNQNPCLDAFADDHSFDVICNVVSVDYLTQPLQVFEEMHRVLRPGGVALISFSNRCFPTKAVSMWLQGDDLDRLTIVASYFHYSNKDGWSVIEALDLKEKQELPPRPSPKELLTNPSLGFAWMNTAASVQRNNAGDPMFVVKGIKS